MSRAAGDLRLAGRIFLIQKWPAPGRVHHRPLGLLRRRRRIRDLWGLRQPAELAHPRNGLPRPAVGEDHLQWRPCGRDSGQAGPSDSLSSCRWSACLSCKPRCLGLQRWQHRFGGVLPGVHQVRRIPPHTNQVAVSRWRQALNRAVWATHPLSPQPREQRPASQPAPVGGRWSTSPSSWPTSAPTATTTLAGRHCGRWLVPRSWSSGSTNAPDRRCGTRRTSRRRWLRRQPGRRHAAQRAAGRTPGGRHLGFGGPAAAGRRDGGGAALAADRRTWSPLPSPRPTCASGRWWPRPPAGRRCGASDSRSCGGWPASAARTYGRSP